MYSKRAIKHYEEGRVFHQKGKLSNAVRAYRKAIKIDQEFSGAHNNLGNVLLDQGRLKEASQAYRNALKFHPSHPMLLNNLGNALYLQGENEKAVRWIKMAIIEDPNYADAHSNLGNALRNSGSFEEAIAAYRQAIKIDSGLTAAYINLGNILMEFDELDDAVTSFRNAIKTDPRHKEAYNGLGNALSDQGKKDEATSSYKKAIEIDPGYVKAHKNLGTAYLAQGRWDNAIASYEQAIALNPDYAEGYRILSTVKQFSHYDKSVGAMEALYEDPALSSEKKMHLSFALGKAYADLTDYDKSFSCIHRGNQLKWSSLQYDMESEINYFNQLKSIFSTDVFAKFYGSGLAEAAPVFILGLPRSGKTLVETMLAQHPSVYPAGEQNFLEAALDKVTTSRNPEDIVEHLLGLPKAEFNKFGQRYIERTHSMAHGESFITNTMPENFYYVGFIKLFFPNAKVIHCYRQPLDACWFIYQKYFFSKAYHYSFDLKTLGEYYQAYSDLIAHWHVVLPDYIYDLKYELLVTETRQELSKLSAFLDLEWDGSCLERYENRPLHQNDIDSWRHYEEQLAPLTKVLN
ncbi:MAG: tetratricopeptide repeat protein [Gammaproteobacteria bacterium]|nr:tetratricopeptide repeat protein [Gammaproteobacteria bacterium]